MHSRLIFTILGSALLWLPSIACKSSATDHEPAATGQSQSQPAASQSREDEIMLQGLTGSGRRAPAMTTETTYR